MTRTELYDWLVRAGVPDPAVLQLGGRCIIGRWRPTATIEGLKICAGPRVAIQVIVEADNWHDARGLAGRSSLVFRKADPGAQEPRPDAFEAPTT